MQDVQNIPNPDVNSTVRDDEFGNHSDVEQIRDETDVEKNIPLPPDEQKPASIEEPPDYEDIERGEIDENPRAPKEIV